MFSDTHLGDSGGGNFGGGCGRGDGALSVSLEGGERGRPAGSFEKTFSLVRFNLRMSLVSLLLWVGALSFVVIANIGAIGSMFSSAQMWHEYVSIIRTPVGIIFGGPGIGLDSNNFNLGQAAVGKVFILLFIGLAIMNSFFVANWTRGAEETCRSELIRSGAVGRFSISTAAFISVCMVNFVICFLTGLGLILFGCSGLDSLALCAALWLFCAMFAGIVLILSQIFLTAKMVKFSAMLVFSAMFLVEVFSAMNYVFANGEGGFEKYAYVSPVAWVFYVKPYYDLDVFPLVLLGVCAVVMLVISYALESVRDFGAGFVQVRRGNAEISKLLNGVFALNFRLIRAQLIGWSVGLLLMSSAYGSIVKQAVDAFKGLSGAGAGGAAGSAVSGAGAGSVGTGVAGNVGAGINSVANVAKDTNIMSAMSAINPFIGFILLLLVFVMCGFLISQASNLAKDEENGQLDVLFANKLSRVKVYFSSVFILVVCVVLLVLFIGVGFGVALQCSAPEYLNVADFVTKLVQLTSIACLFIALVHFSIGVSAKFAHFAWAYYAWSMLTLLFSDVLKFPDWLKDTSALTHFSVYTSASSTSWTPTAVTLALAITLTAVGALLYKNRDLA
jgi:ABC-2 type transport system permease protein